jgi:hypothetical protein
MAYDAASNERNSAKLQPLHNSDTGSWTRLRENRIHISRDTVIAPMRATVLFAASQILHY